MTEDFTYLDHNATTPLKPAVKAAILAVSDMPGNASAIHKMGRHARRLLEEARGTIARFVKADPKAVIVFTSGATEANNLVLKGAGVERVLVSAIEHPSVLQAGVEKEIIPVLSSGLVDLAVLDKMLEGNERQTLISVMLANNETGVIQPLAEVMAIAKKRGALVHTDAVQAAGRIDIDMQKLGVDYLTLSAHKLGGPQGVGCVIAANCAPLAPQIRGGNQEKNIRAGTENLAGIVGFAKAAELASVEDYQTLAVLRDAIERELKAVAPQLRFFGQDAPRLANTSMFSLRGASSETQLIALDLAGICVSNGSACASGTVKPSHVLKAMGADDAEATSSLRVSLGWNSGAKDVEHFIRKWAEMFERVKSRLSAA